MAGATAISAEVEKKIRKFLEVLAADPTPLETLGPAKARKVLEDVQKNANVTLPNANVSERTIKADGQEISLTIVRPMGAIKQLPAFLFIHGGGWVLGDFPTHERLIRDLVEGSGCVAIYVDYSRSPEAKYPTAINQCYAALKWVSDHGKEINVDSKRLALVGNSVGGNMTFAVALMAKEKGGPDIKFIFAMWPVGDADFETGSYHEFAEGHFLTRGMMKWFWDSYLPDVDKRKEATASPLQASLQQLQGLPPVLIQVAECDVLRDEGEALGRKLDEAGVEVTTTRYDGLIHDYGLLNPLAQVPGVRSAILQGLQELKKRLA